MKSLFWSARLDVPGLCLIAALAAGCSFDSSQLRALADGAVGNPAVPDAGAAGSGGSTSSSPDARIATGGSGGSTGVSGSGGVGVDAGSTGAGGTTKSGDAAVPPDLANARDVSALVETTPMPDAGMDAPLVVDVTSIPDVPEVRDVTALPDVPQVPDVSATPDAIPDGIPGPCGLLIDNMEADTGYICNGNGRGGTGSGTPIAPARSGRMRRRPPCRPCSVHHAGAVSEPCTPMARASRRSASAAS